MRYYEILIGFHLIKSRIIPCNKAPPTDAYSVGLMRGDAHHLIIKGHRTESPGKDYMRLQQATENRKKEKKTTKKKRNEDIL